MKADIALALGVASAFLSVACWAATTSPSVVVGGNAPATAFTACPYAAPNDPCLSAPAPLTAYWRQPTFFAPGGYANTFAGTTANYSSVRPHYDVPGVDYAIGNYTPVAQLLDPAVAGNLPTGCSYSTKVSGTGGGAVTCGGSGFAGLLQHINFGPVGGHGCSALRLYPSNVTSYTIDDFYFFNDNGMCAGGVGGQFWTGSSTTITFSNFFMDGNATQWRTGYGGCPSTKNCNIVSAFNISGQGPPNLTIKYGVLLRFAGRTISVPYGKSPGANISVIGSYIGGWDYSILNGHSEWWVGNGGAYQNAVLLDHSVIIQDWQVSNFGPAPIFVAFGAPSYINSFTANDVVDIAAAVGKGTYKATISGCIGATYSAGVCTGVGPYLFISSIRGTIGTGETFTCGVYLGLQQQVTPARRSGYVSAWTFDSATYAPDSVGPYTCKNVVVRNWEAGDSAFMFAPGVQFNNITVAGLYGDFASTPLWSWMSNASATSLAGASISGGVLTTASSVTLAAGDLVYAPDIPGCSGAGTRVPFMGCPVITTSATGTSFQLTGSTGSQGPETIQAYTPYYCTVPATFSGNVDMSGTLSVLDMNKWNAGGRYC